MSYHGNDLPRTAHGVPRHALWVLVALFAAAATRSLQGTPVELLSGDASRFSAKRAAGHLEWLCAEPHPLGSSAGMRAAERLAHELRQAGFDTGPKPAAESRRGAGPLRNVLGVRWGTGAGPALLFVAHHDSTRFGPGAGDDGVGVAALLEVARIMGTGPAPQRTLAILFTDGEEAGMRGASAFLKGPRPAWLTPKTVVVNVEAVGNRGPTVLFQAGPNNGALLGAYRTATQRPHASSLADFIFQVLPNDTDFSVFKDAGYHGLSLAMVGGSSAYHAPFDTPKHLHGPSLQRLGDCLLGLARWSPPEAADRSSHPTQAVFHSPAELALITCPASLAKWLALALVAGTLGVVLSQGRLRPGLATFVIAALAPAAAAALGAAAAWLLGLTVEPLVPWAAAVEPRGDFVSASLAALGFACVGASLLRFAALWIGRDAFHRLCGAGLILACVGVLVLVGQHTGAAWVLAVPLLPSAVALRLVCRPAGAPMPVIMALCGVSTVWLASQWMDLLLITSLRPPVMGAVAGGTLSIGVPLLGAAVHDGKARARSMEVVVCAAGCATLVLSAMVRGQGG